jgi:hypothetical protein
MCNRACRQAAPQRIHAGSRQARRNGGQQSAHDPPPLPQARQRPAKGEAAGGGGVVCGCFGSLLQGCASKLAAPAGPKGFEVGGVLGGGWV